MPARCHSAKLQHVPGPNLHNDSIKEELVPSTQEEVGSYVLQSQDFRLFYKASSKPATVTKKKKKKKPKSGVVVHACLQSHLLRN